MRKKGRTARGCGFAAPGLAVLALVLFIFCGLQARNAARIFPRVYACGVNVGGMTGPQAAAALREAGYCALNDAAVTLVFPDGETFAVTAAQAGLEMDADQAAGQLLDYGRGGGFATGALRYAGCLLESRELLSMPAFDPDGEGLRSAVSAIAAAQNRAAVDTVLYLDDMELRWTKGRPGVQVDTQALGRLLADAFRARSFDPIPYTPQELPPSEADLESVYLLVDKAPVDACFDEQFQVLPETVGVTFDLAAARTSVQRLAAGETAIIPLLRREPQVYAADLEALLYRDKLSAVTTKLTNNQIRSHNIELAANTLDGYVLLPGLTFSYNKAIGQRTTDKGYGAATAYVQGGLVQEVGGGICQLSSTLYYGCLLADLEISFRTGHSYYQTYVPYGMDATVSWGWPDFNFRNNTEYPIRILSRREGDTVTVELWGTKLDDHYVKMEYEISAWYPAGVSYEEDPSLVPGEQYVADYGHDGMTVTTYRCRYNGDGTLLERVEEDVSYYRPRDKRICVPPEG